MKDKSNKTTSNAKTAYKISLDKIKTLTVNYPFKNLGQVESN